MDVLTTEELLERRERLLAKTNMSWKKLKSLGESYQLDDDNYYIYKTIKAIDWVVYG